MSARRARLSLGNAATREADAAARRISGKTEPVIIMIMRNFCIPKQSPKEKCKNVGGEEVKQKILRLLNNERIIIIYSVRGCPERGWLVGFV